MTGGRRNRAFQVASSVCPRIGNYVKRQVGQRQSQARGPEALPLLAAKPGSGLKRRIESASVQISEEDPSTVQGLTPPDKPGCDLPLEIKRPAHSQRVDITLVAPVGL
jgi:hypothetical protein